MATDPQSAARAPHRRLALAAETPNFRERLKRAYDSGCIPSLLPIIEEADLGEQDDGLADLIDADARLRLEAGLPVELARYLQEVPSLASNPCALDTAIEMTLRCMSGRNRPAESAIQRLISKYPDLRNAIETCGVLSSVVCSTQGVGAGMGGAARALPQDFGPALRDGRCRYELRDLLGSGSHGAVYLATDRQLSDRDRPAWVAVKILAPLASSAADEARLIDEATKARRVDHPHVVRVLDRGCSEAGEQYLVYEYVRGGDLAHFRSCQSGPLAERTAARLVALIAKGLQAAHAAGLAHCDLKPGNILMGDGQVPKITDFGIAVRIGEGQGSSAYPRIGNLAFTAPEQFRQEAGASSPLADVYAAGGILYWLLTGEYPNGSSPEEVDRNLRGASARTAPPDPRGKRAVDPDLAAVCRRALDPDVRSRYQSAEALSNDLELWLGRYPLRWRRYGLARKVTLTARREPRSVAAAAGMVLLLIAAVGAGVYMHQRGKRNELQMQLAQTRELAEADHKRLRDVQLHAETMLKVLKSSRTGEEFLPVLTAMETMGGPVLFATDMEGIDLWSSRSENAKKLLDRAKEAGRETDLEPMLWETVYGYWQIQLDNLGEADRVLRANRERWVALKPEDPWLRGIEVLLACVQAKKALIGTGPDRQDSLKRAAHELESVALSGVDWKVGALVRRLALTTKAELYGVEGLNTPSLAGKAKVELRSAR